MVILVTIPDRFLKIGRAIGNYQMEEMMGGTVNW